MFFHNYQTKLQQDVENSRNVKINKLWENLYAELKHIPNKCATVTSNIVLFIVVMAPRSSVRPRNTIITGCYVFLRHVALFLYVTSVHVFVLPVSCHDCHDCTRMVCCSALKLLKNYTDHN